MTIDMTKLAAESPEVHAYIVSLRAEAAENRVKATENGAAKTVAEAQAAALKAEADALRTKVTEFETASKTTTEADWRKAAAEKHGLSEAQAKRLQGSTAEEFEADAAQVAKDFGITKAPEKKTPPADTALQNPATGDPGVIAPDPENEEFMAKLLAAHGLAGSESA